MVTFTERPVIGYYVIEDSEKYRWYWMGRSPRVRKAVETYFKRHKPGTWNTTPNETQKAIAKEIEITSVAQQKLQRVTTKRHNQRRKPTKTAR